MSVNPQYDTIFKHILLLPDGKKFIVSLRADLLDIIANKNLVIEAEGDVLAHLKGLDEHLKGLLQQWFGLLWLGLERVSWNSPASILEKIMLYEAVHPIPSWDHLKQRMDGPNRRCFAFFHRALPGEPLTFVQVAIGNGVPTNIQKILSEKFDDIAITSRPADTAVFYSISSSQKGLAGVDLGNFLIKRVVKELQVELPNLRNFVTLSPIPNFRSWLLVKVELDVEEKLLSLNEKLLLGDAWGVSGYDLVMSKFKEVVLDGDFGKVLEDVEIVKVLKPVMIRLCARYLLLEKKRNMALDPVVNFHIRNGACLHAINWEADKSPKGILQSFGMMVNYNYIMSAVEENNRKYLLDGTIGLAPLFKEQYLDREPGFWEEHMHRFRCINVNVETTGNSYDILEYSTSLNSKL